MKNLSNEFYENLSMSQRFPAAIAAMGRNDQGELRRLDANSRNDEYVIGKLSALLNDFTFITVIIRLTLHEQLSKWLLVQAVERQESEPDLSSMCDRYLRQALKETASVIVARDQWLADIGVSLEDYLTYDGPQTSLIEELVKRSKGKEDPETIELYKNAFSDFFQKRHPTAF